MQSEPASSPAAASRDRPELRSLTSLRGIAALAVVMQHFSATAQLHAQQTIPSLVPHGYLAVDFFFVLSGYIMCYTYLADFAQGRPGAYRTFIVKRLIRLLPLNAAVTLALLCLGLLSTATLGANIYFGPASAIDVLWNASMLQGLGLAPSLNQPAWSVSAEMVAYALFPLLVATVFAGRRLVPFAAAMLAFAALVTVAMTVPRLGLTAEDPLRGCTRCLSEFTLGMLSYRLAHSTRCPPWLGSDRVAAAILCAVPVLLLTRIDLLVALMFPLVVASTARNSGRVDRALGHPWFHFLGVISYSLYLVHHAFRPTVSLLMLSLHNGNLSTPAALLWAFLASLAVIPFAWCSYRWIELPSRRWLRARFDASRAAES